MKSLLSLQSADGWFGASPAADQVIAQSGGDTDLWRRRVEGALPEALDKPERIVRTAIALILLQSYCGNLQSLWKRAHAKAVRFLRTALSLSNAELEEWLDELRKKLWV